DYYCAICHGSASSIF
nr:immunoglobulin light chain junction region [Macaca mulatta]